MKKIIIHIDEKISDEFAVERVLEVIRRGKISETAKRKHYCHLTAIQFSGMSGLIKIVATKSSDMTNRFQVYIDDTYQIKTEKQDETNVS